LRIFGISFSSIQLITNQPHHFRDQENNLSAILSIGFLILIGIAVLVMKRWTAANGSGSDVSLYEKESSLFSPAERSFLGVLDQTFSQQYRIMGKVRLADVIKVKSVSKRGAWQNAFNRIQSKHVDFAVCEPATLAVKFIIELDDASHTQAKRQDRDDFVNKALQAAGIPVYHFAAKRTYSVQEIQQVITASKIDSVNSPGNAQKIKAENSKDKSAGQRVR
jgi:very-short-patch-repair endonuclease